MKIITKIQAIFRQNSESCLVDEYPFGDKDLNVAHIEIKGRYPVQGRIINEVCKELAYIVAGQGTVVVEGQAVELREGDAVALEPGERLYWEGRMKMLVSCTPAWYPEQHKEVE